MRGQDGHRDRASAFDDRPDGPAGRAGRRAHCRSRLARRVARAERGLRPALAPAVGRVRADHGERGGEIAGLPPPDRRRRASRPLGCRPGQSRTREYQPQRMPVGPWWRRSPCKPWPRWHCIRCRRWPRRSRAILASMAHLSGASSPPRPASALFRPCLSPGLIRRHGGVRATQAVLLAAAGMLTLAASSSVSGIACAAVVLGLGYGAAAPASTHLLVPHTPARCSTWSCRCARSAYRLAGSSPRCCCLRLCRCWGGAVRCSRNWCPCSC